MDREKFKVYEDKGVVVCILDYCKNDACGFVENKLDIVITKTQKTYQLKDKYIGIVKCSPEDEFDEIFGKDLAFERAYTKYAKDKKRVVKYILSQFSQRCSEIDTYMDNNKKFAKF